MQPTTHFSLIRRRGIVSALAMLYLILFSTLAIGFYAAVSSGIQVAGNEQKIDTARLAAESGMQFIRYHLNHVAIPATTPTSQYGDKVYDALCDALNNTGNLGSSTVGLSGSTIDIPAQSSQYIALNDSGACFHVTLTAVADKIRVKVIGRGNDPDIRRAIQIDYGIAQNASAIFDYGVASKGPIYMSGNSSITGASDPTRGSVLSTNTANPTPVQMTGNTLISGDISLSNPDGEVSYGNASIGGTKNTALIEAYHIHKGITPPEFPTVDTGAFKTYATNMYTPGSTNLINTYIPPNTNPYFGGNVTISGVLYVYPPNIVSFGGNCTIQGCIVVDTTSGEPAYDPAKNQINFNGNVSSTGVETLDSSYGGLRDLTGSFLLAPGFKASFTGNFGTVNGSIIAGQISMTGNAGGKVQGTVINTADSTLTLNGNSDIVIASTGTSNYPSGVFFDSHFAPLPDTYLEVLP